MFQGVFEQRFAKIPDEHVAMSSPVSSMSARSAAFSGLNENGSSSVDRSGSADVGQQVGSWLNLYRTLLHYRCSSELFVFYCRCADKSCGFVLFFC